MHIFLTGDKRVGKSSALRRFLQTQHARLGGFRTVRTIQDCIVTVSMLPADETLPSSDHSVILIRDKDGFHPQPERFNALGCDLLSRPGVDLLVMDELGPGEEAAYVFQQAVLGCLDGPIPVVGVIQQAQSAFLQRVRRHPNVRVLEVTQQNRDSIPDQMAALWPLRRVSCVVMASGHSKRFGQDKLLYPMDGIPILEHVLRCLPRDLLQQVLVIARSAPVLALAASHQCTPVPNSDRTDNTAETIRLGIEALAPETEGCLFCVADQPWLTRESMRRLIHGFCRNPDGIAAMSYQGVRGNPVLYPRFLFQALHDLGPGQTGRTILAQNLAPIMHIEAEHARELVDVDVPAVLDAYYKTTGRLS